MPPFSPAVNAGDEFFHTPDYTDEEIAILDRDTRDDDIIENIPANKNEPPDWHAITDTDGFPNEFEVEDETSYGIEPSASHSIYRKRRSDYLPPAEVAARMGSTEVAAVVDGLDDNQLSGATAGRGLVVIEAGAGTGKTLTLVTRIAALIAAGADPSKICAATYTREAAAEIRQRIGDLVGQEAAQHVRASTIHAFAWKIILRHWRRGKPEGWEKEAPSISTETERTLIMRSIASSMDIHEKTGEPVGAKAIQRFLTCIDRFKENGGNLDASHDTPEEHQQTAEIACRYADEMRSRGMIDFADFVPLAAGILERNPEIKADVSGGIEWLLIDEFQDVSLIQLRLIKLLASAHKNLTVVGDDDQALYSWRGSISRLISHAADLLPEIAAAGLHRAALVTNRRCTEDTLQPACALVGRNPRTLPKVLSSGRHGESTVVTAHPSARAEGRWIADRIRRLIESGEAAAGEIAVLARARTYARSIKKALDDIEVHVGTMHGSKGREWNHVFLCGVDSETCPNARVAEIHETDESIDNAWVFGGGSIEEERRILHVAMTRAKVRTYISYAVSRSDFGRTRRVGPSPFILEAGLSIPAIVYTGARGRDRRPSNDQRPGLVTATTTKAAEATRTEKTPALTHHETEEQNLHDDFPAWAWPYRVIFNGTPNPGKRRTAAEAEEILKGYYRGLAYEEVISREWATFVSHERDREDKHRRRFDLTARLKALDSPDGRKTYGAALAKKVGLTREQIIAHESAVADGWMPREDRCEPFSDYMRIIRLAWGRGLQASVLPGFFELQRRFAAHPAAGADDTPGRAVDAIANSSAAIRAQIEKAANNQPATFKNPLESAIRLREICSATAGGTVIPLGRPVELINVVMAAKLDDAQIPTDPIDAALEEIAGILAGIHAHVPDIPLAWTPIEEIATQAEALAAAAKTAWNERPWHIAPPPASVSRPVRAAAAKAMKRVKDPAVRSDAAIAIYRKAAKKGRKRCKTQTEERIRSLVGPEPNEVPPTELRAQDPAHWRRELRKKSKRARSYLDIATGAVGGPEEAGNPKYCSDFALDRKAEQESRNKEWARKQFWTKPRDAGEIPAFLLLHDIQAGNIEARAFRLRTMLSAIDTSMTKRRYQSCFITLTLPSKYHPNPSMGKRTWTVDISPAMIKRALKNRWENFRKYLGKAGIQIIGFRVYEAHEDGAPHIHALLYMLADQLLTTKQITRRVCPEPDGRVSTNDDDTIASKFVIIDPKRGRATSYVAGYLTAETAPEKMTVDQKREKTWASEWEIRRFAFLGAHGLQTIWQKLYTLPRSGKRFNALPPTVKEIIGDFEGKRYDRALVKMGFLRKAPGRIAHEYKTRRPGDARLIKNGIRIGRPSHFTQREIAGEISIRHDPSRRPAASRWRFKIAAGTTAATSTAARKFKINRSAGINPRPPRGHFYIRYETYDTKYGEEASRPDTIVYSGGWSTPIHMGGEIVAASEARRRTQEFEMAAAGGFKPADNENDDALAADGGVEDAMTVSNSHPRGEPAGAGPADPGPPDASPGSFLDPGGGMAAE